MSVNFGEDHPDGLPVPDCLRAALDASGAAWVPSALRPWFTGTSTVGCFVPATFEAFAKVPHSRHEGELPRELAVAMVSVLRKHLDVDLVWYAIWNGWGNWAPGEGMTLFRSEPATRQEVADSRRRLRRIQTALRRVPGLHIPGREYYLLRGSITCATGIEISGLYQSASMWWPDDRSWFVATEVDARFTFVGGSRACIDGLLASSELRAIEVRSDDLAWEDQQPS